MAAIDRFITAQQGKQPSFPSYDTAYNEIAAGKKTSHWIWYIFPQLKALGFSSTAKHYGIADFNEACDYLKNADLFKNYHALSLLVLKQLGKIPVDTLMNGSIDAQKLASSLTLFRAAASFLMQQSNTTHDYAGLVDCCDQIFAKISMQGYLPCPKTLNLIEPALSKKVTPLVKPSVITQSTFAKPKIEEPKIIIHPPREDFSDLSTALAGYIKERKSEWGFHYNFLGIMSVIYWLQDTLLGTDYFNDKSKDIKISAATHLKQMIDHGDSSVTLTKAEQTALTNGRLGRMVQGYGGLDKIRKTIAEEHPSVSNSF